MRIQVRDLALLLRHVPPGFKPGLSALLNTVMRIEELEVLQDDILQQALASSQHQQHSQPPDHLLSPVSDLEEDLLLSGGTEPDLWMRLAPTESLSILSALTDILQAVVDNPDVHRHRHLGIESDAFVHLVTPHKEAVDVLLVAGFEFTSASRTSMELDHAAALGPVARMAEELRKMRRQIEVAWEDLY